MATNDGADGSTVNWGGTTQTDIRSIGFSDNGNPVDVTNLSDTTHQYVVGISDPELTFTTVGITGLAVGDTAAATVTWNDGATNVISSAVVSAVDHSGDLDGELTSDVTIKPAG